MNLFAVSYWYGHILHYIVRIINYDKQTHGPVYQLFCAMKNRSTYILIGIAFVGLVIVLGPYIIVFSGPLSRDPIRWAEFGTYVGGVVTPLALLATLAALIQNDKHRAKDLKRLLSESIKTDIIRQIEKIEKDLFEELDLIKFNITIKGEDYSFPGKDILFRLTLLEWPKLIPSAADIEKIAADTPDGIGRLDKQVLSYEVFGLCAAHLNRLHDYSKALEKIACHNAESLYLKRKYRLAVERLLERGFEVNDWGDVAQEGAETDQP